MPLPPQPAGTLFWCHAPRLLVRYSFSEPQAHRPPLQRLADAELNETAQNEPAGNLARYVVSRHLEANRKVGRQVRLIMLAGFLLAFFARSFWPLPLAALLCLALYFCLLLKCVRSVARETGMPIDQQARLSRRYKTDERFAHEVNEYLRASQGSAK